MSLTALKANQLDLADIGILLTLFSGSPLKFELNQELKNSIDRLTDSGLIELGGDLGHNLVELVGAAKLTDFGLDKLDEILDGLPLPNVLELGEELNTLRALATGVTHTVEKTESLIRSLNSLKRKGLLREIATNPDPLSALPAEFNLQDVVDITRMGARLLGIGHAEPKPTGPPPLEFPVRVSIHENEESARAGSEGVPLACFPKIHGQDYWFSVDTDPEKSIDSDKPFVFAGRNWTVVIAMFDPDAQEVKFFKNTDIFEQLLRKKETFRCSKVLHPAFSVFLIPVEDREPWMMIRDGHGVVREFIDTHHFRDVLEKASSLASTVGGTSPLDFKSNLGKAFLTEIGVDTSAKTPLELSVELSRLHGVLENGRLPAVVQEGAHKVLIQLVAGLVGTVGLGPLNIVKNALDLLRLFTIIEDKHEFHLMQLDHRVNADGTTTLLVRSEDVPKLRLDENSDGEKGADKRHILVYHYRPAPIEKPTIGLIDDGLVTTVAIVSKGEAEENVKVEVSPGATTYTFAPSLSLAKCPLHGGLELVKDGKRYSTEIDRLGRVTINDLPSIFEGADSVRLKFQTRVGFREVESLEFEMALTEPRKEGAETPR